MITSARLLGAPLKTVTWPPSPCLARTHQLLRPVSAFAHHRQDSKHLPLWPTATPCSRPRDPLRLRKHAFDRRPHLNSSKRLSARVPGLLRQTASPFSRPSSSDNIDIDYHRRRRDQLPIQPDWQLNRLLPGVVKTRPTWLFSKILAGPTWPARSLSRALTARATVHISTETERWFPQAPAPGGVWETLSQQNGRSCSLSAFAFRP